jgi:hypothetical protein
MLVLHGLLLMLLMLHSMIGNLLLFLLGGGDGRIAPAQVKNMCSCPRGRVVTYNGGGVIT